jgi:hypothetical protein
MSALAGPFAQEQSLSFYPFDSGYLRDSGSNMYRTVPQVMAFVASNLRGRSHEKLGQGGKDHGR